MRLLDIIKLKHGRLVGREGLKKTFPSDHYEVINSVLVEFPHINIFVAV